jgi:hypothetical protein
MNHEILAAAGGAGLSERISTSDPVADLRAAADAIREDHAMMSDHDAWTFWTEIAHAFDRAAERADGRAATGPEVVGWNGMVRAARGYLNKEGGS